MSVLIHISNGSSGSFGKGRDFAVFSFIWRGLSGFVSVSSRFERFLRKVFWFCRVSLLFPMLLCGREIVSGGCGWFAGMPFLWGRVLPPDSSRFVRLGFVLGVELFGQVC